MASNIRNALVLAASLTAAGCVVPPVIVAMQPLATDGQDLRWRNGTPILRSNGEIASVVVAPVGSATGRHELRDRVSFVVTLKNERGTPVEVSEENITASANGEAVHVFAAAQVEDEIRRNAASALTANAVAAVLAAGAAGVNAGTTRHEAIAVTTIGAESVTTKYSGKSTNSYEARRAVSDVEDRAARNADAIRGSERAQLASLNGMFQRTTIDPGEVYGGFVVVEAPRSQLCPEKAANGLVSGGRCKFEVWVSVEGEDHGFIFEEVP